MYPTPGCGKLVLASSVSLAMSVSKLKDIAGMWTYRTWAMVPRNERFSEPWAYAIDGFDIVCLSISEGQYSGHIDAQWQPC